MNDFVKGSRNPVSTGHLVAGLVFLGIAAMWLLRGTGVIGPDDDRWLVPGVLVVAGLTGMIVWLARGIRRDHDERA